MATHISAEKRNRQNIKRRARNQQTKSAVKSAVKELRAAAAAGQDLAKAKELLRQAERLISSAASKGIFHKKNASRKISRLAKLVNKAKA